MSKNLIICGDCEQVLPQLAPARMVFLDPPDNLGVKYDGSPTDRRDDDEYYRWLMAIVWASWELAPIVWLSFYCRHLPRLMHEMPYYTPGAQTRLFLWRFTFGQHQKKDCGNGYRPLLRLSRPGVEWDTNAIRVPSARMKHGDKRADPRGRVPDDVWQFSRVCGTFKERRQWAQNQHPEALLERIIKMSCVPGYLVIDAFGHSFTTARVCRRLGIDCASIEISPTYCARGAAELGVEVLTPPESGPIELPGYVAGERNPPGEK
jgi:site-specific DNA-methyltransferase (adenine-specific)